MVRTLRIGLRRSRYLLGVRGSDLAEDVVEPPALHLQAGNGPAADAGEIGDFANDRMSAAGENDEPVPRGSACRLDSCHSRQRRQLGPDIRVRAAGKAEANGVVMARALSEFGWGSVGEDAAMSDDDSPAAYRFDLLEQMGRDDDRLV